ncbi:exodeoxyribonuclease VII large subunit [Lichenifustis flavocetrariae]|uniref:Exonuclease VII large subunit C-terminal domain-containing protein n=1 Tax=Lichenifustis flavocetrariae TaxID=2949735 RepID=A0AA41ZA36_9HYPH|nr:exodeoxyribonuclease VII large subunit [Lichenifustis flavocetrariae]MCW6513075.1 hypothetical protein [Lichenifustis flavocetrariae]
MTSAAPIVSPPSVAVASLRDAATNNSLREAIPTLTLTHFLAAVGRSLLAGLPSQVWIEATVVAVKTSAYGHQLELVESDGSGGAPTAHLRVFLANEVRRAIVQASGAAFDPALLVGLTTCLRVEPTFSPRWHLQARVLGLSAATHQSIERLRVDQLRQTLQREALFDRQRSLATPPDLTRLCVIHPAGAAGYADVAAELDRWQSAGLLILQRHETPFEGERATAGLIAALMMAADTVEGVRPDLIMIVRGGGASAGLQSLNHETLVRTVCRCPVPIVSGVGHAIDRTLLDEVAWRACDTPSKALALVARLIDAPAGRARADLVAITTAAHQRIASAADGLSLARDRVVTAVDKAIDQAGADLRTLEAVVDSATKSRGQSLAQCRIDADRLWRECAARGRALITDAERAGLTLSHSLTAEIRRRLTHVDPGDAPAAAVTRVATAQVAAAAQHCNALFASITAAVRTRWTAAESALARTEARLAETNLAAVLGRGFALVLGADGHLIRSQAAALHAGRVTLMLADGLVTAVLETSPATTLRKHD